MRNVILFLRNNVEMFPRLLARMFQGKFQDKSARVSLPNNVQFNPTWSVPMSTNSFVLLFLRRIVEASLNSNVAQFLNSNAERFHDNSVRNSCQVMAVESSQLNLL